MVRELITRLERALADFTCVEIFRVCGMNFLVDSKRSLRLHL